MEYVEGERLDRYCDARGLGVPERLALFRKVCAAVAYAHQNLVVHRDLKPANIWVTAEGEPKLLDFGIAKLLVPEAGEDGDAPPTLSGAMTPEYASPEQLRGEAITTASDVYSLGVILCELLTGQRPYRLKSRRPVEIAAAICTEELRRPSTLVGGADAPGGAKPLPPGQSADRLRRRLRGDLDNIVALALRKEPTRRYSSVGQFSEDLRRHREGLPVLARPDTLAYRTSKFVRRNTVGVAAAALVALALVAGLVATTWEARRADRRFNDVRQLAHAMLFEIEPQIASLSGATPARSALVKHALEYLDSLSREAGENRELRRELATAYEKVGEVQGNPTTSNLGDLSGALSSYRKAGELRRSLVQADPRDARARHELAANYENIGSVLWWSNQTDATLANYAAALKLRRALLAEQPASAEFRRGFASLQMSIGEVADWNGRPAEALEDYRQALSVEQGLAREHADDVEAQINVVRCLSRIGGAQKDAGQYDAGADTLGRAEDLISAIVQRHPDNSSARIEQWFVSFSRCEMYNGQKATAKALALGPRMVAMAEALARQDPKNTSLQHDLADSYDYYGESLFQGKRWQESIDAYQKALEIDTRLAGQSPENGEYLHSSGTDHLGIGRARLELGQLAEAEADAQQAEHFLAQAYAKDASNLVPRRELVQVYVTRGKICERRGQTAEARRWFQQALTDLEELAARKFTDPDDPEDRALLARQTGRPAPVGGERRRFHGKGGAAREPLHFAPGIDGRQHFIDGLAAVLPGRPFLCLGPCATFPRASTRSATSWAASICWWRTAATAACSSTRASSATSAGCGGGCGGWSCRPRRSGPFCSPTATWTTSATSPKSTTGPARPSGRTRKNAPTSKGAIPTPGWRACAAGRRPRGASCCAAAAATSTARSATARCSRSGAGCASSTCPGTPAGTAASTASGTTCFSAATCSRATSSPPTARPPSSTACRSTSPPASAGWPS